jgi:hypothetical protein
MDRDPFQSIGPGRPLVRCARLNIFRLRRRQALKTVRLDVPPTGNLIIGLSRFSLGDALFGRVQMSQVRQKCR